ncbi:MAG: GNAT family N-acetyltransferase [Coriobacteriia bacterium]|nr:GNAT family N-acetyltransferase [Coriobacteriia bacterium]
MPQTCEVKHLFVRPDVRGHGLGRALMRAALDHARVIGYIEARVTTLPDSMVAALRLYRTLGFREAEPPEGFDRTQDDSFLAFMSRRL